MPEINNKKVEFVRAFEEGVFSRAHQVIEDEFDDQRLVNGLHDLLDQLHEKSRATEPAPELVRMADSFVMETQGLDGKALDEACRELVLQAALDLLKAVVKVVLDVLPEDRVLH